MTAKEIIQAMKKNGYEKTKGTYFQIGESHYYQLAAVRDKKSANILACATGQAALNLNAEPALVVSVLDDVYIRWKKLTIEEKRIINENWDVDRTVGVQASVLVIALNDYTDTTVLDIANRLEELLPA
jgi:hypothetical protein